MAKTKDQKKSVVSIYKDRIAKATSFVIVKPTKLTPNEVSQFRKDIFDFGANFSVIKNSLFKIALKESNIEGLELPSGEYAVLFMESNYIDPSKMLKKFSEAAKTKDKEPKVSLVAGYLENSLLSAEQVKELADMPDKKTSVGMILGVLDNAMSSVVNVLEDPVRSLATIIDLAYEGK